MERTANYNLPQWAEDDRILRTDFNKMCADIDAAIAGAAQGGAGAWDGLLRKTRQDLSERWPEWDQAQVHNANGLLYNPLAVKDQASVLSGVSWKANAGICAGRGEALSQTLLRTACTSFYPGNSAAAPGETGDHSLYQFTSPVDGVIRGCTLYLDTNFTAAQPKLSLAFTFTAEKRASGGTFTEFYRKRYLVERTGAAEIRQEVPLDLNIPLEKGLEYRLKMTLSSDTVMVQVPGQFGFTVDQSGGSNVDHSKFTLEKPPILSGSHTRTFDAEGAASHALVMLHYRKSAEQSGIAPVLGGRQMELLHAAQRTSGSGAYWEAWYVCAGSFSGSTKLRLDFTAEDGDELILLRYAAALL